MRFPVPDNVDRYYVHAVDLGKRRPGVASALVQGGRSMVFSADTVELGGEVWTPRTMAGQIDRHVGISTLPEVWVCEWPQKYPTKRKYHENLEELHAVGSALAQVRGFSWAKMWLPAQWKGNVPKRAHHRRAGAALREDEWALLEGSLVARRRPEGWLQSEAAHDARDALGILLFALGRVDRGGRPT